MGGGTGTGTAEVDERLIKLVLYGNKIVKEGSKKDLTEKLRLVGNPRYFTIDPQDQEEDTSVRMKKRADEVDSLANTLCCDKRVNAYLWDRQYRPDKEKLGVMVQYCRLIKSSR